MQIGFLLYPHLTQLDLTGPAQILTRMSGASAHFVAKALDPMPSDCGLALVPTVTMADCTEAMADEELLDWLRAQGAHARYVTSVCTGSLVVAAMNRRGLADHRADIERLAKA